MSLTLFTIIHAQDDQLARAVSGFERLVSGPANRSVMSDTAIRDPRHADADHAHNNSHPPLHRHHHDLPQRPSRPDTSRHSSAPDVRPPPQRPLTSPYNHADAAPYAHTLVHPTRPRNRSPYSWSHLRTRSATTSALTAPPMTRAHSLPGRTATLSPSGGSSPLLRQAAQPARPISPLRPSSPLDAQNITSAPSPSLYDNAFQTICEHSELDLTHSSFDNRTISTLNSSRPVSSRRQRQPSPSRSPLPSGVSSPAFSVQRFNEPFPSLHHSGSMSSFTSWSSMPSTPSSNRSRSPSISSLETIEDVPDAEWQALEADRLTRLKIVEEEEEDEEDEDEGPRRSSLEIPRAGTGFGRPNARKRWSVCGAERRADLDLETIWEAEG